MKGTGKMVENFVLRKAIIGDCPQMMNLIRELAIYEKAPDEVTVSLNEMEEAGFGPNAVWKAFVIEQEHQIVGISLFYLRYSTWKGRKLYLEDLVVTREYRGKGLGKRLLSKTIEYAREKGYHSVYWQVLDWNTPAIDFYKTYNATFDAGWINVSIDLSRG